MASRWNPRIARAGGGGGPPPPPGGQDHFAPKYIVGNVPAGDSPTPYSSAGFSYFPDSGDGQGIFDALQAAAVSPGDVYIRPGSYSMEAGAYSAPFFVPAGVNVRGAGVGMTTIFGRNSANQRVFELQDDSANGRHSELSSMRIVSGVATDAGADDSVVRITYSAQLRSLRIDFAPTLAGSLRSAISLRSDRPNIPNARLSDISIYEAGDGSASDVTGIRIVASANSYAGMDAVQVAIYSNDGTLDVGLDSVGGTFSGEQFSVVGFRSAGVQQSPVSGLGTLRISQANLIASNGALSPTGVSLEGRGHVVSSTSVVGDGRGVGVFCSSAELCFFESVNVDNWGTAFQMGSIGPGNSISRCSIFGCAIRATQVGVQVTGSLVEDVHVVDSSIVVAGGGETPGQFGIAFLPNFQQGAPRRCVSARNTVQLTADGSPFSFGILATGVDMVNEGNAVSVFDAAWGIAIGGGESNTVTGNAITAFGAVSGGAILIEQGTDGATVTGNTCRVDYQSGTVPAAGQAPIVSRGIGCTLGNNRVRSSDATQTPLSGLVLADVSRGNTAIGNISRSFNGATLVPVLDLGTGNEVAHNLGID